MYFQNINAGAVPGAFISELILCYVLKFSILFMFIVFVYFSSPASLCLLSFNIHSVIHIQSFIPIHWTFLCTRVPL